LIFPVVFFSSQLKFDCHVVGQMDRILKEERNYILGIIKKIRATGCNVLLIQKSILRDAVTDLSLHYLAKAKILVVKDVEREDIEFISKTLNCLPIANVEHFRAEKLGHADLVEEVSVGSGRVLSFILSFLLLHTGQT